MEPLVELKDISFRYKQHSDWILENINLSVNKGEIIVLTGKSGCGKSTLLKIINGLIPEIINGCISGEVIYQGKSFQELSHYERIKHSGTVFQNPELQLLHNFVFEEITGSGINIQRYVDMLGIKHLTDRRIAELSGGEKQKVAIASVFVQDTPILLFDEPTSNLDEKSSIEFYKMLNKIKKQCNAGIVIVEHWLENVTEIADKIYFVDKHLKEVKDSFNKLDQITTGKIKKITSPMLSADNLSVKINGSPLFNELKFDIYPGEIVGLTGPNGSGKSTLAAVILGLRKPESGKIIFQNRKIKKRMGLVLQNPHHQVFGYNVEEEISFGARNFNCYSAEQVDRTLYDFELKKLNCQPVWSISHGELERTVLAATLIMQPELLILDEPFQGIGVEGIKRIIDIIFKDLNSKKSILLITHNMSVLKSCCRRILRLENGKLYND